MTSFWRYGTCFCSIEMTTLNGQDQFFGITSEKKKEEYTQPEYVQGDTVAAIAEPLKKSQHLQLVINTDQVLIKEVNTGLTLEKAVTVAFPSVTSNGFYFELFDTGDVAYVAISKKEYVDGILEALRLAKLHVVNFRLGFGSLINLAPILKTERIATAKRYFRLKDEQLYLDEASDAFESTLDIAGFQIKKQFVLALAGLLNYDINLDSEGLNYYEANTLLKSQFSEINFFRKTLFSGVAILLLLLLTNFLFFSNYYKKHESLKSEVLLLESKADVYSANFEKVKLKEHRVENMFSGGNSESSLYFNRLVSSKPTSVLFTELQYQPLLKRIKKDKKIQYTEDQLIVGGESGEKALFSNWIEMLEGYDWISEVTILSYGLEGSKTDNFRILIQLADATEN